MSQIKTELQRITFDCPPGDDLKAWLAVEAEKDNRSLSNYIYKILSDHRMERESHASNRH